MYFNKVIMIYYIVFSYLFLIGIRIHSKIQVWNILFAPIVLPVLMGIWFSSNYNK